MPSTQASLKPHIKTEILEEDSESTTNTTISGQCIQQASTLCFN